MLGSPCLSAYTIRPSALPLPPSRYLLQPPTVLTPATVLTPDIVVTADTVLTPDTVLMPGTVLTPATSAQAFLTLHWSGLCKMLAMQLGTRNSLNAHFQRMLSCIMATCAILFLMALHPPVSRTVQQR